jgi:hypothetical protein
MKLIDSFLETYLGRGEYPFDADREDFCAV